MEDKKGNKDFLPAMTKESITHVAKSVNRFCQEVTITKVNGTCPYGHKEGERHIITSTHHDGLCGALWQANHSCIASFHYGGNVSWEQKPAFFTGLCPEMGKVQMEVKRFEKEETPSSWKNIQLRDMTGKGYPGVDKYRVFMEIINIEHHCMYGHKPGHKFEVDPFNIGKACGFLYWGAYHAIQLLFSGGNPPWEPEPGIAHGVCPDLYNQTAYLLTREER